MKLDNLVVLYDNNDVTCDGPLNWINTEDTNTKMRAMGWAVFDIENGTYDVEAIVAALRLSKHVHDKPVFINIRTVIGAGTTMAGTYKAHHGSFDAASVARSKALARIPSNETHIIPTIALQFFRERRGAGIELQRVWESTLELYAKQHPEAAAQFGQRLRGDLGDVDKVLNSIDSTEFAGLSTREVNGILLQRLWTVVPSICGGGADLVNSNKIPYSETDVFHPATGHKGRYIRNGIREHAMASIANGLAAYGKGIFLPITATFFMFYIYAAPGVRMGALSDLQVIHIATHDSFAEGQNGPTHQPVELDSLYRAMPNLTFIRPCDGEELIGAWQCALHGRNRPSMLSLARDPLDTVPGTDRHKVKFGAYVIKATSDADLTLVSCGSNLRHAYDAAERLRQRGVKVRLVSFPSMDLFDAQDAAYRNSVILMNGKPVISVEEYVATAWARYVTASIGMTTYGYSASNASNYRRFELDGEGIEKRVLAYTGSLNGMDARSVGWRQI